MPGEGKMNPKKKAKIVRGGFKGEKSIHADRPDKGCR